MSDTSSCLFWCTDETAQEYANNCGLQEQTAVSWILDYYQQAHPDWGRGRTGIPLVVDVACGSGRLSVPLSEHCERLIGVDISPAQVDVARRVSARPNVEFKVGSATELSTHCPAGGVDLIVAGMAAHFFDTDAFYSEVRRCLRPGGVLALVGYWYHGIRHEDPRLATVFNRWSVDYAIDETIRDVTKCLIGGYRDLHCPVPGAARREQEFTMEMSREEVRDYHLSWRCLFKGGAATVSRMMDELPAADKYSVIMTVFGQFCRL